RSRASTRRRSCWSSPQALARYAGRSEGGKASAARKIVSAAEALGLFTSPGMALFLPLLAFFQGRSGQLFAVTLKKPGETEGTEIRPCQQMAIRSAAHQETQETLLCPIIHISVFSVFSCSSELLPVNAFRLASTHRTARPARTPMLAWPWTPTYPVQLR